MFKDNYDILRKYHLGAIASLRRMMTIAILPGNPISDRQREKAIADYEKHRTRLPELRQMYYEGPEGRLWMIERWALEEAVGGGMAGWKIVPDKRPPLEFDELRREELNGRVHEFKVGRNGLTVYHEPGNYENNYGSSSWLHVLDILKESRELQKAFNVRFDNPEQSLSVGKLKEKLNSEEENFFDYGEITVRVGDKLYRVKDVVHGAHGAEILIRDEEYQYVGD